MARSSMRASVRPGRLIHNDTSTDRAAAFGRGGLDRRLAAMAPSLAVAAVIFLSWFAFGADARAPADIFSVLLCAIGAVSLLALRGRLALIDMAAPLVFGAACVHAALVGSWDRAWPELAVFAGAAGAWAALSATLTKRARIERFWQVLMIVALAYSVWAFAEFVADPERLYGARRLVHSTRLAGAFGSANTAATLFGVFCILAAAQILRASRRAREASGATMEFIEEFIRRGALGLSLLMFAATCLLLTASRAGVAATVVGAGVLFGWTYLAERRGTGGGRVGLFITAGLGAAALVLSGGHAAQRLAEVEASMVDRLRGTQVLLGVWGDAFWLGHGFGALEPARAAAVTPQTLVQTVHGPPAAHNMIVQWLVQAGVVGVAAMAALIAALHARMAPALSIARSQRDIVRAVFAAGVVIVAHGQLDYAVEIPGVAWFWTALIALGVAAGRRPIARARLEARARRRDNDAAQSVSPSMWSAPALARLAFAGAGAAALLWAGGLAARDAMHTLRAAELLNAPAEQVERLLERPFPAHGSALLYYAIGARALDRSPPDLVLAKAALVRSAARDPSSRDAWCNLAHVERRLARTLNDAARADLARCFAVDPAGYGAVGRWRLDFTLREWEAVGPEIQDAARAQMAYLRGVAEGRTMLYALDRAGAGYPASARAELTAALPHNQLRPANP